VVTDSSFCPASFSVVLSGVLGMRFWLLQW